MKTILEIQRELATCPQNEVNKFTGFLLMQVGAENREGIRNFAKLAMAGEREWNAAYDKFYEWADQEQMQAFEKLFIGSCK